MIVGYGGNTCVYMFICVLCNACFMCMEEGAEVNSGGYEDGAKYVHGGRGRGEFRRVRRRGKICAWRKGPRCIPVGAKTGQIIRVINYMRKS